MGDRARLEDFSKAPLIDLEVGECSLCSNSGEETNPVYSLLACINNNELVCVDLGN